MLKINTLFVVAVWFVTVNAINKEVVEQLTKKAMIDIEACAKEVSASSSDVDEIFAHRIPSRREGKCVYFCLYKLYNTINDDGTLNLAGAFETVEGLKNMDFDLYTKIFATVKNCQLVSSDSDPCIFASNLAECFIKEKEELGITGMGLE